MVDTPTDSIFGPGPWSESGPAETTTLLNEAMALVDHTKGLLSAHVADLAGPEAYREYWNKGGVS